MEYCFGYQKFRFDLDDFCTFLNKVPSPPDKKESPVSDLFFLRHFDEHTRPQQVLLRYVFQVEVESEQRSPHVFRHTHNPTNLPLSANLGL